jgi:hypothetical protein
VSSSCSLTCDWPHKGCAPVKDDGLREKVVAESDLSIRAPDIDISVLGRMLPGDVGKEVEGDRSSSEAFDFRA